MIADNFAPVKTAGNDATTDFYFGFAILAADNIRVYLEDVDTGVQTLQTTGYTLTFNDEAPGGVVSFDTAPSSQYYVIIGRDIPKTQDVPYKTSSGFQGDVVQSSFDKITAMAQDNSERLDRTMKIALGSSGISVNLPISEPNKLIGWNAAGNAFENKEPLDANVQTATESARDAAIAAQAGAVAAQAAAEVAAQAAEAVSGIVTASQVEAEAATDNTKMMTALRVKQEVQKSGAVSIPAANISGLPEQVGAGDEVAKSFETSYLAETDGFAFCYVDSSGGSNAGACILCDSSNPPTTVKSRNYPGLYSDAQFFVKKGRYWKASVISGIGVYCGWIPYGV